MKKYYVINWDKVKTIKHLKTILQHVIIRFDAVNEEMSELCDIKENKE